jgi:hypothetical protein
MHKYALVVTICDGAAHAAKINDIAYMKRVTV